MVENENKSRFTWLLSLFVCLSLSACSSEYSSSAEEAIAKEAPVITKWEPRFPIKPKYHQDF